jgi:ABC-2 type transport system permease protein
VTLRPGRVAAVVVRQAYLLRSSVSRIVPMFAWVAIDIVLWGFISRYLNAVSGAGFDFVPVLLGGVLLWDFFARVMHGVTMAFFEDVWSRNFLNLFASPLTLAEYLTGLVVSAVATSLVGLVAMLALAVPIFGLSFASGAAVLGFVLVLFLFGIALGIAGSAVVLRLGPAAEWFIWPVPALLSPFVGVFYPMATLPAWMQAIGRAMPPSYVFENLRALAAGGEVSVRALALATALALVDILAACALYRRVFRHAVRTGLLARYSAETAIG